jgi:hypothetical protein
VLARWQQHLPVTDATPFISLNEGSTPLIHSHKLSAKVGRGCEVYIKYEGLNPTGSFKDRGMTVALSKAVEEGAEAVILRLDRQHERCCSGLRGAGEHRLYRAAAGREDRLWQAGAGVHVRREGRGDRGELR